jgi:cytochrome c oxidase subunit II
MKLASLATALLLAYSVQMAPVAMAQDAPAADAPAADAVPQGEAPAANAVPQGESVTQGEIAPDAPEAADDVYEMPELPVIGKPIPGGVNYQRAVTSSAHDTHWLSHWVHMMMLVIVLFVSGLIGIVAIRFNAKSNPNPARFTHNTKIEIAWTLVPVLILIFIGSFSLPILFKQLEIPEPDLTIKTTGNQWYWSYEYPDNEFTFDSLMLPPEDLAEYGYSDDLYRLATDTAVVVPVGAVVNMQVTGADVIHSWTIPAFGVKMDGIPGRLNETWFQVDEPGVYFGQCSELCGIDHAFMPITVKALMPDDYAAWLEWAIEEYGGTRGEADVAQANN